MKKIPLEWELEHDWKDYKDHVVVNVTVGELRELVKLCQDKKK